MATPMLGYLHGISRISLRRQAARGGLVRHQQHQLQQQQQQQHQQQQRYNLSSTGSSLSSSSDDPPVQPSNNALFRSIPIQRSILNHIETLGLGLKTKRKPKNAKRSEKDRDNLSVMNADEERRYFQTRPTRINQVDRYLARANREPLSAALWMPPPPFASTWNREERLKTGYLVKRQPVKIIGSVGSEKTAFPWTSKGLPEVALAGRSNVGKSTLLNALLYGNQPNRETGGPHDKRPRRMMREGCKLPPGVKAVVSAKPGETKKITFYQLSSVLLDDKKDKAGSLGLLLVDLPGYGFAFAKPELAQEWKDLMQRYLLERGSALKRILLLIDARHGMKKADIEFLQNLETVLFKVDSKKTLPPVQIVLTKCDLVSQVDLARRAVQVREQLSSTLRREPSLLPVMLVSARPGVGFNNVNGERALGGILELQREVAAIIPHPIMTNTTSTKTLEKGQH